jgi:hypothetical protein
MFFSASASIVRLSAWPGAIRVQPIHDDSTKRIVHGVELFAADLSVDRR